MDIVFVAEVVKQHDMWAYPYNALRNQALSRAATEVSLSSASWLPLVDPHESTDTRPLLQLWICISHTRSSMTQLFKGVLDLLSVAKCMHYGRLLEVGGGKARTSGCSPLVIPAPSSPAAD